MSLKVHKNILNKSFRIGNLSKNSLMGLRNQSFSSYKLINHKIKPFPFNNISIKRNFCVQTKKYKNIIEEFFDGFRYDDVTLASPIYSTKIVSNNVCINKTLLFFGWIYLLNKIE